MKTTPEYVFSRKSCTQLMGSNPNGNKTNREKRNNGCHYYDINITNIMGTTSRAVITITAVTV